MAWVSREGRGLRGGEGGGGGGASPEVSEDEGLHNLGQQHHDRPQTPPEGGQEEGVAIDDLCGTPSNQQCLGCGSCHNDQKRNRGGKRLRVLLCQCIWVGGNAGFST